MKSKLDRIRELLHSQTTLALATAGENSMPRSTPLFFIADDNLRPLLVFLYRACTAGTVREIRKYRLRFQGMCNAGRRLKAYRCKDWSQSLRTLPCESRLPAVTVIAFSWAISLHLPSGAVLSIVYPFLGPLSQQLPEIRLQVRVEFAKRFSQSLIEPLVVRPSSALNCVPPSTPSSTCSNCRIVHPGAPDGRAGIEGHERRLESWERHSPRDVPSPTGPTGSCSGTCVTPRPLLRLPASQPARRRAQ